jgi:hypothetical protein
LQYLESEANNIPEKNDSIVLVSCAQYFFNDTLISNGDQSGEHSVVFTKQRRRIRYKSGLGEISGKWQVHSQEGGQIVGGRSSLKAPLSRVG